MRAINTIKNKFKLDVGYSDHSEGIDVAHIAVSMGAKLIEKHFTADKNQKGPDHKASLSPEELAEMIKKIRLTEIIMGSEIKQPTKYEQEIKVSSRRSLCLTKDMKKGDIFNENNLRIVGTQGSLEFPNLKLWTYKNGGDNWKSELESFNYDFDEVDPYTSQINHFIDVINKKVDPITNASDAKSTLKVALAILESAKLNSIIKV